MTFRWHIAQFFEKRWWFFYLRRRAQKRYLDWKKSYWRQFLQTAGISCRHTDRIIDVGCGPAGMYMVLTSHEIYAIDPLLTFYEQTFTHFKPSYYPNVRFFSSAIETFTTDRPFNLVFCLNAINHVDDLSLGLKNLFALTDTGGDLWISTDAHRFLLFKWFFKWMPADILHPHQYTTIEYEKKIESVGFQIKKRQVLKKGWIFDYVLWQATKLPFTFAP
jgi:2-polyprenyl-6-hydroxyphenyl methylase/3-demethylubiquinone-9 3-methyltransferase